MVTLITVIGHGLNLVEHHINHYKKYVDKICYIVYETDQYPFLGNELKDIIEDEENVEIVKVVRDRIFDWEKVTKLYNFIKNKNPNDWFVIADIDEFHLYPNDDLSSVINNCEENGWEVVRGGFIDRIGGNGEFSELNQTDEIWKQYPNAGFFRYPLSKACPNKICIVKGYLDLTSGQHYAKIDGQTTWKWQGWNHPLIAPLDTHTVQVHHFKWDKTAEQRILDVASIKQDYSYSDEYAVMFKELKKRNFKIDLDKPEFMFELGLIYPEYNRYKNWKNLIKKIASI